ncbi:hypothetical protein B0H19DRAFT_1062909 [Mycena capillaripes]|nr:hypothetical protein B0H19DRAFT_1062909 [Mycena capillaripes]
MPFDFASLLGCLIGLAYNTTVHDVVTELRRRRIIPDLSRIQHSVIHQNRLLDYTDILRDVGVQGSQPSPCTGEGCVAVYDACKRGARLLKYNFAVEIRGADFVLTDS